MKGQIAAARKGVTTRLFVGKNRLNTIDDFPFVKALRLGLGPQVGVQGSNLKRRMIWDGNSVVSRRFRLPNNMTPDLVHHPVSETTTKLLYQPCAAEVAREQGLS